MRSLHVLLLFLQEASRGEGGREQRSDGHLLAKQIGKDGSTAFFGGVYEHSNAAHNVSKPPSYGRERKLRADLPWRTQLLSMMRVGVLHGGVPHALEERSIPPSQHLRVTRYDEMPTMQGPAAGMENGNVAE